MILAYHGRGASSIFLKNKLNHLTAAMCDWTEILSSTAEEIVR